MEPHPEFSHIDMPPKNRPWRFLVLVIGIVAVVAGSFFVVGQSPSNFVPGSIVHIPDGASVRDAGDVLYQEHVVRSASLFQFVVKIFFPGRPVIAGDFAFDKPHNILQIASLVTGGGFGSTQVRITIPEGSSSMEIGAIVAKAIPAWDVAQFDIQAKPYEGYLFPETYIVFKSVTIDELIDRLRKEYVLKVSPLDAQIAASGHSEAQIITMASLLEKEAKTPAEAQIISGILWKRLAAGKPLEVDAPFLYALNKTSAELTLKDLQTDGPYNTYTRTGLPAGPIGNPGMTMILAALNPVASPYWYYLHDAQGQIHYATTYAQHLANKSKYLN